MGITPLLKKAGSRRIPFGELPPVKLLPGEPPAPAPPLHPRKILTKDQEFPHSF